MRATIEKYATLGLWGGTGGTLAIAVISGQPALLPIVLGSLVGAFAGASYGALRARLAR